MKIVFIPIYLSFLMIGIYSQGQENITNTNLNTSNETVNVAAADNVTAAIPDTTGEVNTVNTVNTVNATTPNKETPSTPVENSEKKPEEVPTQQRPDVIQPADANVENLDKWKDFNLTREMEKLYNDTHYQETHEDKLIKQSEQIKSTEEEEEETEEERLRNEWEEQVANFIASDILTVKVKGRKHFNFYEQISEVPSLVRVAYFVNGENVPLDFLIYNPKNGLVHKTKSKGQIFHEFTATVAGIYKIVIDNGRWNEKKKVSLAIHSGNNTDSKVEFENIDKLTKKINYVHQKLNEYKLKQKVLVKKLEGHYEKTLTHNKQIVRYSILECTTMVIVLFVQLYYLKHLLSKVN